MFLLRIVGKTKLDVHATGQAPPGPPCLGRIVLFVSPSSLSGLPRPPAVSGMRRRLTQEEFCIKYALSVASLRDWEQGRFSPDPTARAYLTIIDRAPEAVEEALTKAA